MHRRFIHGLVQGETSKTWIDPKENKQDVLLDYQDLLSHHGGEGNKAVWIKKLEALRTFLIYKNEKSMLFENFLTNMQTMLTGFSENEEILNNS